MAILPAELRIYISYKLLVQTSSEIQINHGCQTPRVKRKDFFFLTGNTCMSHLRNKRSRGGARVAKTLSFFRSSLFF